MCKNDVCKIVIKLNNDILQDIKWILIATNGVAKETFRKITYIGPPNR